MKHLILAFLLSIATVPALAETPAPAPVMTEAEAAMLPVARAYVNRNRFWMEGTYDIRFAGHEGDLLIFNAVRKSEAEIKAVMVEDEVAQFKRMHPKAKPAILAEVRASVGELYDSSMELGQANDIDPQKTANGKRSFQILVDPATSSVQSERF